jgi:hypothetical protein
MADASVHHPPVVQMYVANPCGAMFFSVLLTVWLWAFWVIQ